MRFVVLAIACLTVSCANQDGETGADGRPAPLSQRLNENNGYVVNKEGEWVPRNNQRSSFETQGESPYFQGGNSNQNKEYKTGDYARKSWWGNKEYGSQSYQGESDGSRFRQSSRHDGQAARETGSAAPGSGDAYQTGGYRTGSAREAAADGIAKPSDAETDVRRRVFQPPEIIDWRQQRTLTLEQSRGILGR